MAVVMLRMIWASEGLERRVACCAAGILWIKCVVEATSGQVVFGLLHVGSVGTPITICHGGGVLGGLIAVMIGRAWSARRGDRHQTRLYAIP